MFFTLDQMQREIRSQLNALDEKNGLDLEDEKLFLLKGMLKWTIEQATILDTACEFSIDLHRHEILSSLRDMLIRDMPEKSYIIKINDSKINQFFTCMYDVIAEMQYGNHATNDPFIKKFLNFAKESNIKPIFDSIVLNNSPKNGLSFSLLKKIAGIDVIKNLRNSTELAETLQTRFKMAEDLQKRIDQLTTSANFVLLNQGFENLGNDKHDELKSLQDSRNWWGSLLLTLFLIDFIYLLTYLTNLPLHERIITQFPFIALSILIMYFFRLCTHEIKTIKTQLLQINLRISLCQFIQDYVRYATEMRKGADDRGKECLKNFEQLVFSNIVMDDMKIPSTLDGIDQISNLIKSLKS